MRISTLLLAAVFGIATSAAAQAQDKNKGKTDVPPQELKAKVDYCKTCHGLSGQGFRGSYPMPRLAGQQPEYLENQLQAFIDRRRSNPVMFNVAHVLSPEMEKALAQQFKDLNPKPLGGAPRDNIAEGKRSIRKESRNPTSRPALPVMGMTPKAATHFLVWPASFTIISTGS